MKSAHELSERAMSRDTCRVGNLMCRQSVNPVTTRFFRLGAADVRPDQHCTA